MFYAIIFLLLTTFSYKCYNKPRLKQYKLYLTITWLIFVLVAGLRYELGVDFFSYKRHLDNSPKIFEIFKYEEELLFEPGYKIMIAVIKTFTNEIQIVLLTSSTFCTCMLFHLFKKYIPRRFIFSAFLTYFFSTYMLMEMQALRQAIAAGIIFLGYDFLVSGNRPKAYICLLLGFAFHSSALFFLPIFFFIDKTINFIVQYVLLVASIIIFVTQTDIISIALEGIAEITPSAAMALRMSTYLDGKAEERGVYIMFFVYLTYYVWLCFINKRINYYSSNKLYILSHNLIWLYLIFSAIFWKINFLSTRVGWYFLVGFSLMLPILIEQTRRHQIALIFVFLINLNLARHFIIPDSTTKVFAPYESYIECKWFGVKPTGRERATEYLNEFGETLRED